MEDKKYWKPEDFGFINTPDPNVYLRGVYELRDKGKNDLWLLRKRSKKNTILVSFFGKIPNDDYDYAEKLLKINLLK